MDYKERYNNIISQVIELNNSNQENSDIQDWIKTTFPEIFETNDEKIRKLLIDFFKTRYDISDIILDDDETSVKDIIDWLEQMKPQEINTPTVNKMVDDYANTRETSTNSLPINCMIRAYRQGINTAINTFNLSNRQELDKDILLDFVEFIRHGDNQYSSSNKDIVISIINDYLKNKYDIDINNDKKNEFKILQGKWYACFKYYRFDDISEFVDTGIYFAPKDDCLMTRYGKVKYLNPDNYGEYFREATADEINHYSSWFSDYSNRYS